MKQIIIFSAVILIFTGCQKAEKPGTEKLSLYYFLGSVTVDNIQATLGQQVNSGSKIVTAKESVAEVKIGEETGVRIREESEVIIYLSSAGWEVQLVKGAALNIVKKGTKYAMRSPAAVAAVRGTIFYAHAYDDSTTYICTCNGKVDILSENQVLKNVSFAHHEGYNVLQTAKETVCLFLLRHIKEASVERRCERDRCYEQDAPF